MTAMRAQFEGDMLRWLRVRLSAAGVPIMADTPLFGDGLLDSIRILELIAYTERAIGSTIPDSQMRMDNFRTVRRIADAFLAEEANAAG